MTEVLVSYLATSIAFFSNSFNFSISELFIDVFKEVVLSECSALLTSSILTILRIDELAFLMGKFSFSICLVDCFSNSKTFSLLREDFNYY